MLGIIKAVVGWNGSKMDLHPGYIKYANELDLNVERTKDKITLTISIQGGKHE